MAVTPILGINLIAPTQTDKTTTMNDAIAQLEAATNDQLNVDMSAGAVTLSTFQFTRYVAYVITGLTADHKLTVPLVKRLVSFRNDTAFVLTVGGATGASITIAAHSGVIMHCDGTACFLFGVGGPGPTGPTGPAGGAINIDYAFISSTTNADPGGGNIALSNATQNLSTAIYADIDDTEGTDWTAVLDTLDASSSPIKGQIRLFVRADPTKWILFNLTARISHTGYREFTVAVIGSSAASPFTAADDLSLSFARTGDIGLTGSIGATGTFGVTGAGKLVGNATTVAAVAGDVAVGAGLTMNLGTLTADAAATVVGAHQLVGNAGTTAAAAGDISIGPGLSLTTSGTLDITPVLLAPGNLIANTGTASAVGTSTALSTLLDDVISASQGAIVARGTAWGAVAAGTTGQVLVTQGTTGSPAWHTMAIIDLAPINAGKLVGNGGTASAAPTEIAIGVGLTMNAGTLSSTALGEALFFAGTWNATSNTPTLTSGAGTPGAMYTVTTAGTTAIDGISAWNVGDKIAFDGVANVWRKIDGISNEVISVAGRTGAVVVVSADIADLQWNGGTVTTLDPTLSLSAGTLAVTPAAAALWTAGTVSAITSNFSLAAGTLDLALVPSMDGINALIDPFTLTGLAAAQGGGVTLVAGASSTAGNPGGTVALVGGAPGVGGTGGAITITGKDGDDVGTGGGVTMTAGNSGAGATGNGGNANVRGGNAVSTSGNAGSANVTAGNASGNGTGGFASMSGGIGAGTGTGGGINVIAGPSGTGATGNGGVLQLRGGAALSTNGTGGGTTLTGGVGAGTGAGGIVQVTGGAAQAGSTGTGGAAQVQGGTSGSGATGTGGGALLRGGLSAATDGAGGSASVVGGAGTGSGAGGAAVVQGGAGGASGTGNGGAITMIAGASGTGATGTGGAALLRGGGALSTNGAGGTSTLQGGVGSGTGNGAAASVLGGNSGTGATGNGGAATMNGGNALSTNGTGGAVTSVGGAGTGTGAGGAITLTAGAGAAAGTGNGGAVTFTAGSSGTGATGAGGAATLKAGTALSTNGAGGLATLQGGTGSGTGNGGNVNITGGVKGASGNTGSIVVSGSVVLTGGATFDSLILGAATNTAVTKLGNGLFINAGVMSAQNVGTVAATTTALVSPVGVDAVLVNMGTVDTTINISPGFPYQRIRLHVNQGATAHVPNLGTTIAFGTDVTAYPAGMVASKSDHLMLIANSTGSIWNLDAYNRGLAL